MNHNVQQRAADASDLDTAFAALARIGRRRGRLDPVAGTIDRALIDTFAGLHELRRLLDAEAVGAGLCSPFVHRQAKAGPALQAQARAARLAQLEEEERQLEARRARTWRGAHSPHSPGPSATETDTGEDDRPASAHNDPDQGPSAATSGAGADIGPDPSMNLLSPTETPWAR